jgi:hypothetical protein
MAEKKTSCSTFKGMIRNGVITLDQARMWMAKGLVKKPCTIGGKRRLGEVSKENVLEADSKMKRFCPMKFKTKQYVSACLKITGVMTKELVKRGSKLTHQDVAAAANAADKVCGEYKTGQYGSVCARVVGGYIRVVAQIKPHLT